MTRRIRNTKGKQFILVYGIVYQLIRSIRIAGLKSMQIMDFHRRVKASSDKKRGTRVVQTSPYSPTTEKESEKEIKLNYTTILKISVSDSLLDVCTRTKFSQIPNL